MNPATEPATAAGPNPADAMKDAELTDDELQYVVGGLARVVERGETVRDQFPLFDASASAAAAS